MPGNLVYIKDLYVGTGNKVPSAEKIMKRIERIENKEKIIRNNNIQSLGINNKWNVNTLDV